MSIYTPPKLNKGKEPKQIPKGSSKEKEIAKNVWYVSYSYEGKQVKVKGNINRYKDPKEKQEQAEILLVSEKQNLIDGYNPFNKLQWTERLRIETTTLEQAIPKFKTYHEKHNSRKKTIGTYISKLNALSAYYPGILIADITTIKLENFIQSKIDDETYSQNSVKSAKRVFSTFFNRCIKFNFIKINPIIGFDSKIKSSKETKEQHVPFTDEDLTKILAYIDINDKYCAFFCRMIYYTCLRPAEIRGLKIENIDLKKNTITIPSDVKKVTINNKEEHIEINTSFIPYLKKLNLDQYPSGYYLTGDTVDIIGANKVGENTPYNKLISALKKIELDKKGYDLYSFKHTSNIKKYLAGWTLAQIMKANRHSNISTTEIYLKKLGQFVDIKEKAIPVI